MDREKVITGLELCTNISPDGCLMLCPYKDEKDETYSGFCEQVLKQDALALLQEQEHKDRMFHALEDDWKRLKVLLKKQEAAEPKQVDLYGKEDWYGLVCVCPDCNAEWMSDETDTHFCPKCGREVKWQ